jgi:hypothetical protein
MKPGGKVSKHHYARLTTPLYGASHFYFPFIWTGTSLHWSNRFS